MYSAKSWLIGDWFQKVRTCKKRYKKVKILQIVSLLQFFNLAFQFRLNFKGIL